MTDQPWLHPGEEGYPYEEVMTPNVPAGGFSERERIANLVHLLVIGAQDEAETVENIVRTLAADHDFEPVE